MTTNHDNLIESRMKKKIKAQFITNKMLNEKVEQKKYNSKKVKKKKTWLDPTQVCMQNLRLGYDIEVTMSKKIK